jgi:hypothetical protein
MSSLPASKISRTGFGPSLFSDHVARWGARGGTATQGSVKVVLVPRNLSPPRRTPDERERERSADRL